MNKDIEGIFMNKKVTKQALVTSIFILFWIFAINIVTPMITSAPAWPMFFVTIFFFVLGGDVKQIPSIFLSGFVGILLAFVVYSILGVIAPVLGVAGATALLIFIALAIIIVGGNWFPMFLNNITFGYLTVCAIDLTIIPERFAGWMLMLLIGGPIILGGALLLATLAGKICKNK